MNQLKKDHEELSNPHVGLVFTGEEKKMILEKEEQYKKTEADKGLEVVYEYWGFFHAEVEDKLIICVSIDDYEFLWELRREAKKIINEKFDDFKQAMEEEFGIKVFKKDIKLFDVDFDKAEISIK